MYPLNDFLYKIESKEKDIIRYSPEDKLNYIKFYVLDQRDYDNDDFYFENVQLKDEEMEYLKDLEILKNVY